MPVLSTALIETVLTGMNPDEEKDCVAVITRTIREEEGEFIIVTVDCFSIRTNLEEDKDVEGGTDVFFLAGTIAVEEEDFKVFLLNRNS